MKKRLLIAWLAGLMVVSSGGLAEAANIIWINVTGEGGKD